MNASNIVAWSLQIGALAAIAWATQAALRLCAPRARLWFWELTLLLCLVLPLVRPWRREAVDVAGSVTAVTHVITAHAAAPRPFFMIEIAPWLLGMGIMVRTAWLAAGFRRLRRYRRNSRLLAVRNGVPLLIGEDVVSPVTFGLRRPVVLVPAAFTNLNTGMQEAILAHELLHVRRRDWLFTVAEEIVRAVFWFHPAIWWVLGEIALAREQEVDRLAIERMRSRERYVDALLAVAGAEGNSIWRRLRCFCASGT